MKKFLSSLLVFFAIMVMASSLFAGTIQRSVYHTGTIPAFITPTIPFPLAIDPVNRVPNTGFRYPSEAAMAAFTVDFEAAILNPLALGPSVAQGVSPVGAGKSIGYRTDTNIAAGGRIYFTLTNATFANIATTDMYLIGVDTTNPTNVQTPLADYDSQVLNPDGSTTYLFIAGNNQIVAGEMLQFSTDRFALVNPRITVNGPTLLYGPSLSVPGAQVTLQVTRCYDSNGDVVGALTAPEVLITSYKQFAWATTKGLGEIDVPNSFRSEFVNALPGYMDGAGSRRIHASDQSINITGTDLAGVVTASGTLSPRYDWPIAFSPFLPGTVRLVDSRELLSGFFINLATSGVARLDYNYSGAQLNKLGVNASPLANGLTLNGVNFAIISDASRINSWFSNNWANAAAMPIIDTVPGHLLKPTQILNPQVFSLKSDLTFIVPIGPAAWYLNSISSATPGSAVTNTDASFMTWKTRGSWQGTVPYHWAGMTQADDTFIKIFNNSPAEAMVFVDVYPDAGSVAGITNLTPPIYINGFSTGTNIIPAHGVGLIWARDIATAANILTGAAGSFAAVYTVDVRDEQVTAFALQKRDAAGATDRVLPVLTGYGLDFKQF